MPAHSVEVRAIYQNAIVATSVSVNLLLHPTFCFRPESFDVEDLTLSAPKVHFIFLCVCVCVYSVAHPVTLQPPNAESKKEKKEKTKVEEELSHCLSKYFGNVSRYSSAFCTLIYTHPSFCAYSARSEEDVTFEFMLRSDAPEPKKLPPALPFQVQITYVVCVVVMVSKCRIIPLLCDQAIATALMCAEHRRYTNQAGWKRMRVITAMKKVTRDRSEVPLSSCVRVPLSAVTKLSCLTRLRRRRRPPWPSAR